MIHEIQNLYKAQKLQDMGSTVTKPAGELSLAPGLSLAEAARQMHAAGIQQVLYGHRIEILP